MKTTENKKTLSYLGLAFVVLVWGTGPLTSKFFLDYYSPTFGVAWGSLLSSLALLILCRKKLKTLTREYFRVALPLGFFYTSANLCQKIGLKFTTPTVYSFLENLSCIVVPFLVWWFLKKRPGVLEILGSVVCLCSAFVLSGLGSAGGFSLGLGEGLCALAGILYGVNIAGTGAFTKKLDGALYIMILLGFESVASLLLSLVFHGVGLEPIAFSFDPLLFFSRAMVVLISTTLCWVIRTNSMKHVDATVVAVMMPFSSVIAGVLSVLCGMDALTTNLVLGAVLGFGAMMICAAGDIREGKKTTAPRLQNKENGYGK